MSCTYTIKSITGHTFEVEVGEGATGLEVKNAIQKKDSSCYPYMQCLMTGSKRIGDYSRLSKYGLKSGAVLKLILSPYVVHVMGTDGKMYEATFETSDPDGCTVTELYKIVEKSMGQSINRYHLYHKGRPLERTRGKTLKDLGIKAGSILTMAEKGFLLNVTDPLVDICFLLDCTSSMWRSIDAVKKNIQNLQRDLVNEFKNCDLLFAFVRYTDFDLEDTRTTYLQFTDDTSTFQCFVGNIEAKGGGDAAEDVMGGLQVAFSKLNWRDDAHTKVIIHIADCPCHGLQYHDMGKDDDSHPGGDPFGITHESMMQEVVKRNIQYCFGYISRVLTDKMIGVFNHTLSLLSEQKSVIIQFDAIDSQKVGEAIQSAVIDGVYSAAFREVATTNNFKVDREVPDWNAPSITEEKCLKTPSHAVHWLSDIKGGITLEKPSVNFLVKIAPNPFVEGSKFWVFYATDLVKFRHIILKQFKNSEEQGLTVDHYMKQLEIRLVATAYVREFNKDRNKPRKTCSIEYTPLDVITKEGVPFLQEPLVSDEMKNFKSCEDDKNFDLLQAFSHYSWTKSNKRLVICNHQGFKERVKEQVTLVDPTIHSVESESKYGQQDEGRNAIKVFFDSHVCSSICEQMKLEKYSDRLQLYETTV